MDNNIEQLSKDLPKFGIRHRQILLLFWLTTIAIGMRVHMSVAVVAMTDSTASSNPDIPVYDWHNRSLILSSFFWGYIGLQLFAAEFGRRYGSKPFLLGAMTINSTAVCLVPLVADKLGSYGVMGSRTVQGLCQGFVYPSVSNLLGRWTHVSERSRLGSLALSGASFGTIITLPVVGFISASSLGWPVSFYLYGGVGFLWVGVFAIFGESTPAQCKSISKQEKAFIESSSNIKGKKLDVPIKSILTNIPFWSLFLAQVGQSWGYNTLLTEMPNYMNKVMNFDMKSNGILSAAPYTACFLLAFCFGFTSDFIINKKYLSRTASRKIFNGISGIGAGTSLFVLSFLPKEAKTLSVLMLVSAVGIQSAAIGGYQLNHIDLSPNFAGLLQSMCNSVASGLSILAPLTVQLVVTEETDKSQWRIVFILAGLMYIIPSIVFALFGSGVRQTWDGPDNEETLEINILEARAKKISVWSIMSV